MYQNLIYAVKKRILSEIEYAYQNHPAFTEKVKVYHKFPYKERIQYGVVLRNTSASQIRMSADNYMAEENSHVRLARETNHPGLAIEWVRENLTDITQWTEEDVSAQLGSTQRMFRTSKQILSGKGNTNLADNVGQIEVRVDGVKVLPEYVNGDRGVVMLRRAPGNGTQVLVNYYCRQIVDPGIYVFDFTEDTQFLIAPIYTIDKEMVIEATTGTEVTASLNNSNVDVNSEYLTLEYKYSDVPVTLERDVDYSMDYPTGEITFLQPLTTGYQLFAEYRWQPTTYPNGPYDILPYHENHEILPGVVLAVGRRAKKGDRQVIVVSEHREPQAKIYGGHWTMNFDLAVVAKDPIQMEEMADQLINWLWVTRKNVLEFQGITLNVVEPTGESKESFIESTGDVYHTTGVTVNLQSEWQEFKPYLYKIRNIVPDMKIWPGSKNYAVSSDYTLSTIEPDTRPVLKYPTIGYERVI